MVWELPLVEISASVLILAALAPGSAATVLSLRPVVWLGTISYSLYLWQQFGRWLVRGTHPWPELLLTVILTLFSFYVVERPFRKRRTYSSRRDSYSEDAAISVNAAP